MPAPYSHGSIKRVFEIGWEPFMEVHPEKVTPWMKKTIQQMLWCRTEKLGFHMMRCNTGGVGEVQCEQYKLIVHSCKQKICSSCGKVGNDNWLAKIAEITFPTVHDHITWTVPYPLRPLIQANYTTLIGAMYEASAKAIMKYCRNHGFKPGMVSCSQTYGSDLSGFNPHIHMAVTQGGVGIVKRERRKNIGIFVSCDYFDAVSLSKIWVAIFLKKLRKLYKQKSLVVPYSDIVTMKDFHSFNRFLDSLVPKDFFTKGGRKGWSVFVSKRGKKDPSPIGYIGRYIRTPPLSEGRIVRVLDHTVSFLVNDYERRDEDFVKIPIKPYGTMEMRIPKQRWELPKRKKEMVVKITELIEKLIQHIPPKNFKNPRFYGLYANRSKKEREELLKKIPDKYKIPPETMKRWEKRRLSWAERRKQESGVDPMTCPDCGGRMEYYKDLPGDHPIWKKYNVKQLRKMKLTEILGAIAEAEENDTS